MSTKTYPLLLVRSIDAFGFVLNERKQLDEVFDFTETFNPEIYKCGKRKLKSFCMSIAKKISESALGEIESLSITVNSEEYTVRVSFDAVEYKSFIDIENDSIDKTALRRKKHDLEFILLTGSKHFDMSKDFNEETNKMIGGRR